MCHHRLCSHRCLYTEIQHVHHVQHIFLSQHKRAAEERAGRTDGFEPERYEMMLFTLCQYLDLRNYLRVIIAYNYFHSQLLRVSFKAALLLICTQSRSTGGLPVNNCLFQQMSHMLLCNLVNKTTIPKTINNTHVVHFDLLG